MTKRINGRSYRIVFSRERQFLNGVERVAVIDHTTREIRFSKPFRNLLAGTIAQARRTAPVAMPTTHRHCRRRRSVPMTVSGTTYYVLPWPWWPEYGHQ